MRDGFSEREIVYRAEDLILRLRDVRSCRIITDETGAISEIHVVASSDRPAKFIARDVETALKAELGLGVDYRKIGVVMMDPGGPGEAPEEPATRETPFAGGGDSFSTDELIDAKLSESSDELVDAKSTESGPRPEPRHRPAEERRPPLEEPRDHPSDPILMTPPEETPPEPVTTTVHLPLPEIPPVEKADEKPGPRLEFLEDSTRIELKGLDLSMREDSVKAEVRLARGRVEGVGTAEDRYLNGSVAAVVAEAAVRALGELLDEDFHLCLSGIREIEITGRKAIVTAVEVVRGRDSSGLSGCAFVGRDTGEAAVMAVLDAVNRPFGRWKSKREIHYRIR